MPRRSRRPSAARARGRGRRSSSAATPTSATSSPACSAAAARPGAGFNRWRRGTRPARTVARHRRRIDGRASPRRRSARKRTVRTGSGTAVEIGIPPGVESGGRLRVPGQGGRAPPGKGGVPGDLYLDIEVTPDPLPAARRRRHRARPAGDVRRGGAGRQGRGPDGRGAASRSRFRPARRAARGCGCAAAASSGPTAPAAIRSCRVEIVAPKLKPDDAETRKLFEEIARRTAKRSGAPILIGLRPPPRSRESSTTHNFVIPFSPPNGIL